MKNKIVSLVAILLGLISVFAFVKHASADSQAVDFESPPYSVGDINGQDGWIKTGTYDVSVVNNTYGFSTFGLQSLRMSDAVTSGSFGDQTFAKPLVDSVGETSATAGTFSVGTKGTHFEMQFDIASALPTLQTGMHVSVSPDRGDGSRMSYLRFEDQTDGIHVFFDDVTDPGPIGIVATFNEYDIATISRSPHTIKLSMDTPDGPANDVVKVWIDGSLIKKGTSWEDYYRYDPESSAEQSPRIVKTVLFRESGAANLADSGNGFLIDNLSLSSSTPVMPSIPVITTPANGAIVPTSSLVKVDWTDSTGTFSPFTYRYEAFSDAGYTSLVYDSGMTLSASEIPTPGTPPGDYYLRVQAMDSEGNVSDWSNGPTHPYKITVTVDPHVIGPPTNKDQCMKNGWKTFNNPTFKNQGQCVDYVEKHQHDHDKDKDHGDYNHRINEKKDDQHNNDHRVWSRHGKPDD